MTIPNSPAIHPIKLYISSINLKLSNLISEYIYNTIANNTIIFVIMEKFIITKYVENIDEIKFIIKISFVIYVNELSSFSISRTSFRIFSIRCNFLVRSLRR